MPNPTGRQRAAILTLLLASAAGITPSAAHASIADAKRGYELVSPSGIGARGISAVPSTGPWSAPISADGRVLFRMSPAVPGTVDETLDTLLRAERTATGWNRTSLTVPQRTYTHDGARIIAASPNLNAILMQPEGKDRLAGETLLPGAGTSGSGIFSYNMLLAGGELSWLSDNGQAHDYAGDLSVPDSSNAGSLSAFVADDGTTLFSSRASLHPSIPTGLGVEQLYRRSGTTLVPAAIRPDGSIADTGASAIGASEDGRTLLYAEALAPQPGGGQASDLVVAGPGGSKQANRPRLSSPIPRVDTGILSAVMTPDGGTVAFLTNEALVDDDTDTSPDLYRYTAASDTLTLLSKGHDGAPGGNADDCSSVPRYQSGPIIDFFVKCDVSPAMMSRDGSTVYFFAPEQLDGTEGQASVVGLYVSEDGGLPRHVVDLPGPDQWTAALGDLSNKGSYEVTRQGDLVFESANQVGPGQTNGLTQVWRYDRNTRVVSCVSCRVSGGTPIGPSMLAPDPAAGQARGTAPFAQVPRSGGSARVTADGSTVFFTSYDRLSVADQSSAADVYATDIATGTQQLITTGASSTDAYLMGTDADGSDVFFLAADSLDPRDDNGPSAKLYDARVGGGFAAPVTSIPCRGAACRTITEAAQSPGSATQSVAPDETSPPDDLEPEILAPRAADRARIATKGRLPVKVTGLTPGSVAALRVRVRLSSRSSVTARITSRRGAANRTITARFTRSQRLRIASARRKRTVPIELRLDHGAGEPAILTTSIARVRKGR